MSSKVTCSLVDDSTHRSKRILTIYHSTLYSSKINNLMTMSCCKQVQFDNKSFSSSRFDMHKYYTFNGYHYASVAYLHTPDD